MTDPAPNLAPEPGPAQVCAATGSTVPVRELLGSRPIILVGMMGVGKTTVGRRLAQRLAIPFRDADEEIERAAGMSVADIFASYGETSFRDCERKVIARLLEDGPAVLATGGGAFMNQETRAAILARAVSVWLRADHGTIMRRVRRRNNRPLLRTPDPDETMRGLLAAREPVYAQANIAVDTCDGPHDRVVARLMAELAEHLAGAVAG